MLEAADFTAGCMLRNSETLGIMLSFIGLMIYEGMTIVSVKLLLISLLIVLGNPIGTHILSKAAYKSAIMSGLWKKTQRRIRKMQIYIIEALLLVFLIITTVCVIFCKDILCAAVIYSEFQFLCRAAVSDDGRA